MAKQQTKAQMAAMMRQGGPSAAKARSRQAVGTKQTGIARALSNPGATKRSATATAKLTALAAGKKKRATPAKPKGARTYPRGVQT